MPLPRESPSQETTFGLRADFGEYDNGLLVGAQDQRRTHRV